MIDDRKWIDRNSGKENCNWRFAATTIIDDINLSLYAASIFSFAEWSNSTLDPRPRSRPNPPPPALHFQSSTDQRFDKHRNVFTMENWGGRLTQWTVSQSRERQSVNCRTVSRFIWFIRYGLPIGRPSAASFRNEPFDSQRSIREITNRFYAVAIQTRAKQRQTRVYIYIVYTQERKSGGAGLTDGISLDPVESDSIEWKHGESSLIYSEPRKSFEPR